MTEDTTVPKIERVSVDLDEIRRYTSEEDFTALAVSLMGETGSYVAVAACTLGNDPSWDRDHAAVGGNVVRLYKTAVSTS